MRFRATLALAFASHALSFAFHLVGSGISRIRIPIVSAYRVPSGIPCSNSVNSNQCKRSFHRLIPYIWRNADRIRSASCSKLVTRLPSPFGCSENRRSFTACNVPERGFLQTHLAASHSFASGIRSSRESVSIIRNTLRKSKLSRTRFLPTITEFGKRSYSFIFFSSVLSLFSSTTCQRSIFRTQQPHRMNRHNRNRATFVPVHYRK